MVSLPRPPNRSHSFGSPPRGKINELKKARNFVDPEKREAERKKRVREEASRVMEGLKLKMQHRAKTGVELTDDGSRVRGARGQFVQTNMVHQRKRKAPRCDTEAMQQHGAGGTGSGHKAAASGHQPGTSASSFGAVCLKFEV